MTVPVCLPLHIDADSSARVDNLLVAVSLRISNEPDLLRPIYDGTYRLECPLPDGYQRSMNHWATGLSARLSADGRLFEINETSSGVSGGWMASCIPPRMYRIFLFAWLSATQARQLELFA